MHAQLSNYSHTPTPYPHQAVVQSASLQSFRGNKQALPSKPCVACGRPMVWRRHWAKNWAEVKFCSAACRWGKPGGRGSSGASGA